MLPHWKYFWLKNLGYPYYYFFQSSGIRWTEGLKSCRLVLWSASSVFRDWDAARLGFRSWKLITVWQFSSDSNWIRSKSSSPVWVDPGLGHIQTHWQPYILTIRDAGLSSSSAKPYRCPLILSGKKVSTRKKKKWKKRRKVHLTSKAGIIFLSSVCEWTQKTEAPNAS